MATVSKTVRLQPEVIEQINSFEGDNFTAKFSALVDIVYTRRAELTKQIKDLQIQRDKLLAEVSDLERVMYAANRLSSLVSNLNWSLNECQRMGQDMQKCMARISEQEVHSANDAHD